MDSSAFFGLIAWLYYGCFLLLVGPSLFIAFTGKAWREWAAQPPH